MKKLFYFIIATLLLVSCENVDDLTGNGNEEGEVPVIVVPDNSVQEAQNDALAQVVTGQTLNSTVFVNIKTIDGLSVNGASVTISGATETSEDGFVFFKDIALNEQFVGVKIEKEGYVTTVKNFTPSTTKNNTLIVTLFEGESKTVNAESGGELSFDSGVALTFLERVVVNADGTDYTGDVSVRLYYHNDTDTNYLESQPGALVGLDEGELFSLITEGMISMQLLDTTGAEVFVKDGQTVSVTVPADEGAPEDILLWNLNEVYGVWVSSGLALQTGDVYEFEVSNFSSFNLGYKNTNGININFTLSTERGGINVQDFYVFADGVPVKFITTNENSEFTLLNASPADYFLQPVSRCDVTTTESISINESGDYNVSVPFDVNYGDYSIFLSSGVRRVINFSGNIPNCGNYDSARFFVKSAANYVSTNLRNDSGSFNFDLLFCEIMSGIPADSFESVVHFYNGDNIENVQMFNFKLSGLINSPQEEGFMYHSYIGDTLVDITGCEIEEEAIEVEVLEATEIEIGSELLNHVKRRTLGLEDSEILTQDLADTVTSIEICDRGYTVDALDLAKFPNLEIFSTCGEQILNVDQFPNLLNLEELSITFNDISDLSAISSLSSLTELYLNRNNIDDVSALSSLTNLIILEIGDNPLTDEQVDELRIQLPNTEIDFSN